MQNILFLAFLCFGNLLFAQSSPQILLSKIRIADRNLDGASVIQLCEQLIATQPTDTILIEALFYQNDYLAAFDQLNKVIENFEQLLPLVANVHQKKSVEYITLLNDYGTFCVDNNQYANVPQLYEEALIICKKNNWYSDYIQIAINYGFYYELVGAMKYSIRYYKESLSYIKKAGKENQLIHIEALHSLARIYEIEHRYDEAESLYSEAIRMAEPILEKSNPEYIGLLNDFGMLRFFMGNYQKALPYLEIIQQLIDNDSISIEWHTSSISNLADCYAHLGRYDEAEQLYLEMETIERTLHGESYYPYPTTISRIGDLYAYQGRYNEAKKMHLKAIALAEKYFPPQDLYLFYNLEQAYLFFAKIKDWEQVKKLSLSCFERNCTDALPSSSILSTIQTLVKEQTFATIPYALKALKMASKAYWETYQITTELTELQQAYELQLAIRTLLHRIKNSFSTELDKLELLSMTQEISELGIQIAQELYQKTGKAHYQSTAFMFLENNKYLLLQDALQAKEAQTFGNLPVEVIQQEVILNQDLLIAKTQKLNAQDENSQQKSTKQYNDILRKIDQFKQHLEANYPNYYAYKYAAISPSISSIQQQLKKGVALIEYFIGKEHVYTYVLTAKNLHFIATPLSSDTIRNKVHAFRQELTDYKQLIENSSLAKQRYTDLAYWFYDKLLAPSLVKIPGYKELIIIPDGLLGHVPFESFLSAQANQQSNLNELDFLIRKYTISYAYSANLLLNNVQQTVHKKGSILGMAASYDIQALQNFKFPKNRTKEMQSLRQRLNPLNAVNDELNTLEGIFQGDYYYGEAANEQTFKKEAPKHAILHLAMHGILDQKHPILSSLAFTENGQEEEDNFLHAYEISQSTLTAQLVVLSACETGYGKFRQGEGVMSLARSFMYAGVPSMVVSMWQVNDASTAIIMKLFYQNLSTGMDKAAALQEAKLSYIEFAHGITAHPAFWAPFIQLGDASPIQLNTKSTAFYWGLLSLIILTIFLFIGFRFSKKR